MTSTATVKSVLDDMMDELVKSVAIPKTAVSSKTTPLTLPSLYSTDKSGRVRSWSVTVSGNTVTKVYGLVDGKQTTEVRSHDGKNVGRANETTGKEQAQLEAERSWKKQLDKGYKPQSSDDTLYTATMAKKKAMGGTNYTKVPKVTKQSDTGVVATVEKDITPMKCQVWSDEPKVLKHFDFAKKGIYVQPKFDGIRCTATIQSDGSLVLLSNTSKQFMWLKSLREQIRLFIGDEKVTLDGELYSHNILDDNGEPLDHVQRFGIISGSCRPVRGEPSPYEEQIQYHVFDIVDTEKTQVERFAVLEKLFAKWGGTRVVRAPTTFLKGADAIEKIDAIHVEYANDSYEGLIIRAPDLMYRLKYRALKMRKYKFFIDAEYKVTGAKLNKGVGEEHFVWVCVSPEGITFSVTPEGSEDLKRRWYKNRKEYIGKMLTVKYKTFGKNNVPIHGVGKGFRHSADLEGGYDSE